MPACVPKRSAELSDVQCRKLGGVAAKCSSSHGSKERVGFAKEASAILSGLILAIGVGRVVGCGGACGACGGVRAWAGVCGQGGRLVSH